MEKDLHLDQDTFITKLALEILEGRSFDITGKKCPYEMLFNNVELVNIDFCDENNNNNNNSTPLDAPRSRRRGRGG